MAVRSPLDSDIYRSNHRHRETPSLPRQVSKKFFPELAVGFEDPRIHLHVGDAIEFLRHVPKAKYDAIIVDSSDPVVV
ncbi:spermine synthase-like [Hibiscus syriacus]|uniref:spermine synthase-like n=1 Tax=Hibiscus syriacus TaxID=106335 RepID=UPI001920F627|nr:spermine synthase-like [Hibiscus syriacus]